MRLYSQPNCGQGEVAAQYPQLKMSNISTVFGTIVYNMHDTKRQTKERASKELWESKGKR